MGKKKSLERSGWMLRERKDEGKTEDGRERKRKEERKREEVRGKKRAV